MTTAEYYQLPEYAEHDLIQLIDGEVVIGMPPIPLHQAVVGEVLFLLMTIAKKQGGRAFTAPLEVYLDEYNSYEPDVLYLTPDSPCQVEAKRLTGAPDLVVEVLSTSTAKLDRDEKYRAYERHGVREYWIIDPLHQTVEVWYRVEGRFVYQQAYAGEDTFASPVLGETVSVRNFFETKL
jgi:Uma2 family endonuclease